jgi:hypothetical protein
MKNNTMDVLTASSDSLGLPKPNQIPRQGSTLTLTQGTIKTFFTLSGGTRTKYSTSALTKMAHTLSEL